VIGRTDALFLATCHTKVHSVGFRPEAKAIGLAIPAAFLQRADELIE
jgi:hypothetical protein